MTDAEDLQRLRRAAAAGLRRAASAFGEPFAGQAIASPAARHRAATGRSGNVRSIGITLDNELAVQELVNLLLPAIENALRNRRDIGAP